MILVEHFLIASSALKEQLLTTFFKMNTLTDTADPTELITHQRFLSATIKNIRLEAVWRQKDSDRKLQNLRKRVKGSAETMEEFKVCLAESYDLEDLDGIRFDLGLT